MRSGAYSQYLQPCATCGANTSKTYARANGGKCKGCTTGVSSERLYACPDCGERRLTAYQRSHRYHCDACTRETDPVGHYREVMGYNE